MTASVDDTHAARVALYTMPVGPWLPTAAELQTQGDKITAAIAESAAEGARLALFPEGSLASPHKKLMSRSYPDLDESDWTRVDWAALRRQLSRIAAAAKRHGIAVAVGAVHDLGPNTRPHNCLYIIDGNGQVLSRYDKRRLSTTEITYMYTPGTEPVLVEVAGLRVGFVLGVEVLFPDLFTHYADEDADLVVAASTGGGIFEQLARSYAMTNVVPIALVIPPAEGEQSHSGVYGLHGPVASAPTSSDESVVYADIQRRDSTPTFNYQARHGFYDERLRPTEPRTVVRTEF